MSRSSRCTSVLLLGLLAGCGDEPEPQPAEDIFAPLGEPLPHASEAELRRFRRGRELAMQRFDATGGLGPHFNVSFCAACHERPVTGGAAGRYRNFLLVHTDLPDGSRQPVGIFGTGIQPQFRLEPVGRWESDPDTTQRALRNPIPFFGAGLLAQIPDAEILRREDPNDDDGDGISGRANFDGGRVARFGRKAQTISLEGFIRGPLFNHLGITTNPLTPEQRSRLPLIGEGDDHDATPTGVGRIRAAQAAAPDEPSFDEDGVPDPELAPSDLFDLVAFTLLLAAPQPDPATPQSERGRMRFERAACDACHVPSLRGPQGLIPAFSDLLLHDMGEELADGVPMGAAEGHEFRTQPLWGVAAVAPYLHDGRADTLSEAILAHGGEARASRDAFEAMSEAEQSDLLAFLRSLGGADQRSDGLSPPDAPVPAPGEYGGPGEPLSDTEHSRFLRGRALFDHDFHLDEGLGPFFNGDSCRACHFDPVIGGSGPLDVDVVRHGILNEDGTFRAPARGTVAHRHATDARRPPYDAEANVEELRQTPALFGLGLVDRIPDADIEAHADPEDANDDGISGRVHRLDDGRLGRFGWKASIASLRDFLRDALSTEMGLTIQDEDGLTRGVSADEDGVDDPEVPLEDVDDLDFYLQRLAPPPAAEIDGATRRLGSMLFEQIGCDACHVPRMSTDDGEHVDLFSDLLLHDVAPEEYQGVGELDAQPREFRTAPLWGLRDTAPYMHDGRAPRIEDAIAAHFGEADAARRAYEALDADARAALLTFLGSL